MNKRCSRCETVKPFDAFYKASKSADGHSNRCRACDLEYQRDRKVERAETRKRWYAKNGRSYLQAKRQQTKDRRQQYLADKLTAPDLSRWRRQQALRAQQKAKATPVWVDAAHHTRIRQVYAATQLLQEVTASIYHVDHIVPLVSDDVCGLHVWWNLQPLPEVVNVLKNNTLDPRLYPDQGVLAFPSGDGLTSAQFAVHERLEKSDE
jgi:hypothetical protein